MIRLVLALLSALALALNPVSVQAAGFGQDSTMSCGMQQKMPAKPANHGKMDCCTPACQVSSAAALLPDHDLADQVTNGEQLHAAMALSKLSSFAPTGLDPPPRRFS
ncbi:MAG: hypothetical protein V4499_02680 [Pseudomonadota bacterium]